jgi:tryptophanyl-tRNA synthetase
MLNLNRRFFSIQYKPVMLVSEYGEILNVKPMTKMSKSDGKHDIREVIMIDDNTDVKTLQKKLNHSPKAYFLYNPTKGHWQNAQALY